jgi:hypothetical protein
MAATWMAAADAGVIPWAALITAVSTLATTIIWVVYRLHKDAIAAHDKRADAWQAAAERQDARNDVLVHQVVTIVEGVKTLGKQS